MPAGAKNRSRHFCIPPAAGFVTHHRAHRNCQSVTSLTGLNELKSLKPQYRTIFLHIRCSDVIYCFFFLPTSWSLSYDLKGLMCCALRSADLGLQRLLHHVFAAPIRCPPNLGLWQCLQQWPWLMNECFSRYSAQRATGFHPRELLRTILLPSRIYDGRVSANPSLAFA